MPSVSLIPSAFRIMSWIMRPAFREEVMEDFADTYLRGETPIPVCEMQSDGQVSGPAGHRQGPRRRSHGHGPLCAPR